MNVSASSGVGAHTLRIYDSFQLLQQLRNLRLSSIKIAIAHVTSIKANNSSTKSLLDEYSINLDRLQKDTLREIEELEALISEFENAQKEESDT